MHHAGNPHGGDVIPVFNAGKSGFQAFPDLVRRICPNTIFIGTFPYVWQTVGMNSIVYYASLMSLDESLLEAAVIDGANRRQQIFHVIIPHLVPIMVITTILGMGSIFGGDFGLFYQVPKDQGLLYSTTDIISTYTYRAMLNGSLEKSAAVGLFQSVVGLIMVVTTNAIVKKISPENSLF